MEWYEELPTQCPPNDATTPHHEIFFRAIKGESPQNEDFLSQRKEKPTADFKDIDECIAHALSVFKQESDLDKLMKLPRFKNGRIIEITLKPEDGLIKKTFKKSHYSWWRSKNFTFATSETIQ